METLIRFFMIFKTFIVFLMLEVLSLVLVFTYNDYQHGQYFNSSNELVGRMYEVMNTVTGYFSLNRTNEDLARENSRLKTQLSSAQAMIEYYREDSTYMQRKALADSGNYSFVTARVISTSFSKSHNYLTLDKGSADGIQSEMGVIGQTGVVGIVSAVSSHFSIVIPLLNISSRLSVKVKNKSQTGALVWKGEDYRYASLEEVPTYIPVAKGDSVVTSGYSTIFPEGMYVGKVSRAGRSSDNNLRIDVSLGIDFSRLAYVDVIKFKNAPEVKKLQEEGTDENEQ